MQNDRPGFVLYLSQKNIIDELTDQEAGILIKAIYEYQQTKKVPKLSKLLKITFLQFKNTLDNDEEKYQKKCAKNKENIEKYWKKKKEQTNTNEYDRIRMYTNINKNININRNKNKNINLNKNINTSLSISKDISKKDMYARATLEDPHTELFSEVISCFNKIGIKEQSFKIKKEFHFKNTKTNQQLICNLLDAGYTKEDIFDVIYLKYDQWIENNNKNKEDMSTYYRPSTILGEKFDEYLQEAKFKEIS